MRDSRLSRAEALARSLEEEVSTGAVSAGDWLGTKEDLRQRFNVAVATVNEAVKLLDARGLVEVRSGPGGGVFVAAPDARMRKGPLIMGFQWAEATMADYQEVRGALEPLICAHALHHHSGADIQGLEQIVDKMEASLGDPPGYVRLNTAFHRRMAKMCRNAPLRSLYVTLLDFYEHFIEGEGMGMPKSIDPSNIIVHRELVSAIASGDAEQLEPALRRHDANRLAFGMLRRPGGA